MPVRGHRELHGACLFLALDVEPKPTVLNTRPRLTTQMTSGGDTFQSCVIAFELTSRCNGEAKHGFRVICKILLWRVAVTNL